MIIPVDLPGTAADSVRVATEAYSATVVVTAILAVAALLALGARGSAGARMVTWRGTVAIILAVCLGRLLPAQWTAWVLPESLAWPLVQLGSVQLTSLPNAPMAGPGASWWIPAMLGLYLTGIVVVLVPALVGRRRLARAWQHATPLTSLAWRARLDRACQRMSVAPGSVRLAVSPSISVPMTWGTWRPVILLPEPARHWPAARVHAVLLHELAHVRGRDATGLFAARLACALFWFHPGVWWLAARFAEDAEVACDDRVLLSGVRRSDYAEWLADSLQGAVRPAPSPALSLIRRKGVRRRMAAIIDSTRRIEAPARRTALSALAITILVATPLATMRVAPTREVLTAMMRDARWTSRAWAVVRLAQRPDSVAVARDAARHDPDPSVRAWARYALDRSAPSSVSLPRS